MRAFLVLLSLGIAWHAALARGVILGEVLGTMLDNFVRDHHVERFETMWSARILNGYFSRLGLAPGQRFASKDGYLAHFSDARRVADGDWVVS